MDYEALAKDLGGSFVKDTSDSTDLDKLIAQYGGSPVTPEEKKKEGLGTSLRRGAEQLVSSGQTALESVTKGGEEAAIRAQERQADIQRRLGSGASLERLKDVYSQQGLLPAAKELAGQIPSALAEQAPNIGATIAGGLAGAAAGSVVPGVGTVLGGIAGAFAPSFIQQYGGNIQRQAEAQEGSGKPLDISRTAAAGTAVPQAGLDVIGTLLPLGGNIVSKILGPTIGKLVGGGGSKLAEETLLATITKGTATGVLAEIPTEVTQQMLERAQAGLPLTNDDALKEYGETAFAVSLLGPIGIIGRVSNKAQAGRDIAQAQTLAAKTNEPQQVNIPVADAPEPQPFFVSPAGDIADSLEKLQEAEQYKQHYANQVAQKQQIADIAAMPKEPARSPEQNVAYFDSENGVQYYKGVPNRTGSKIQLFDVNNNPIKTVDADNKSIAINPTDLDVQTLKTKEYQSDVNRLSKELDAAKSQYTQDSNAFKRFLQEHPIKSTSYGDVIAPVSNPNIALPKSKLKGMFINSREKGFEVDDLARMAAESGLMTEAEINNPDDQGGVNAFIDKVKQIYDGEPVSTPLSADAESKYNTLLDAYAKSDQRLQDHLEELQQIKETVPTEEQVAATAPEFVAPEPAVPAEAVTPAEYVYREPVTPSFRAEVATPYSDKFIADGKRLASDFRRALDKMGLKDVGLRFEEQLTRSLEGKTEDISGAYFDNMIRVSLSSSDPIRTLNHEALHAMKDLGMFSNKEWKMLEDMAKSKWMKQYDIAKGYGQETKEIQLEEAIAHAFADYQKQKPVIKAIANRVRQFLGQLRNLAMGKGFRTAESVFQRAAEGKLKPQTGGFNQWFKGSKVVDENGKPLVMYHGTDAAEDFSVFDTNKKSLKGTGSFFSKEPSATYSTGENARVIPAYLSIKNPKYLSPTDDAFNKDSLISQGYDGVIYKGIDGTPYNAVAFYPEQIKSSIGNTGAFSKTSADIRYEVPERKKFKAPMQGVDPAYAEKLRSTFTQEKATVKEKMEGLKKNFFERMVTGLFDEFRAIKKYDPVAYMMARLSKSTDGGLQGLLEYGQLYLKDGALDIRPNTKGLLDILAPVGSEVDQYQSWKALSRDAALPVDKRSLPADLVAGRDQLIQGNLNEKPRKSIYEQALQEENELNKSVLQIAKDLGLIDQEGYNKFANDIYYIPFYKMMEDGDVQSVSSASKLTGQQFSKALKGGKKKLNDLMENVLMNWSHILSAAMKNQAAVKTIDAAEKMGAAKIATMTAGKYPPDTVKVMKDGQAVHYQIFDPDLVDAIATISYLGPKSQFLDVAKGFTNALRYGITMSPAYKVRNLIRDSIQSASVSELGTNMFSNVYNGLAMSKDGHPTFMSALAAGGIFEMGVAHEGNQAKLIKRLVDKGVNANHILDNPDKIKAKLQSALEWYNEQGNKFENANRLALYQNLIDSGKTHLEASYAARDLMDFSMQGQFKAIKIIGSVVPFFNARLQGLYKLGRDGVTPTYRVICNATTGAPLEIGDKEKAMRFTTISSAVMLASLALYGMYKDDEDFKRREDWDRDNFWWFKIGDTAFRIPKPFEIGSLGTIAERTYEQITDENVEGKIFAERMNSILANTLSLNPMPQMIKPMIDLYANKDSFTGAPIESAGMEKLSKQERINNKTSGVAKALGGISEGAAKVLTFNPQAQGFSPIQVDYAIKAYFGWLGATATSTADLAVEPFQEGTKVHPPIVDTLAMGFIKTEPETQSKYMTQFYQNNANLQSALADMRHYAELGDSAKVQEILEEKGNDIALAKVYDKTSKEFAVLRKQSRFIENSKDIPSDEKRAEMVRLKILMSDMAAQMETLRKQLNK
jgi:hypothetical protein